MKVKGLDGRVYGWSFHGCNVGKVDEVPRSGLHLKVRACLKGLFPTESILEEVSLPGSGGLSADFYLPVRKTIVEAHGEQHFRMIAFFHHDRAGWTRQQKLDRNKLEWAAINNIRLVSLHHDEDLQQWTDKLLRG